MSDVTQQTNGEEQAQGTQIPAEPPSIHKTLLEPINHGLAASCRVALELGVPADKMINMLLNHLSSVVARIEPAGARELLIKELVSAFAPMCRKHVEARYMTPGGVLKPGIGVSQ